jgi:hypothetical protein
MPTSSKWSTSFRSHTKTLDMFLSTLMHATFSIYLSSLDLISLIISDQILSVRLNIKCTHH